tara:strand:- start:1563 stop:2006 length:444 start_codon:yes stop_codon:yes gene_type:complete
MLAELAAANAAFAVIKQCVSNGKELASAGKSIGDFVFAKEELERKATKKKNKGVRTSELEEFMALEQLKQQETQLREIMIWAGRAGLWDDWQKFQAQARKSRRLEEMRQQKKRQEIMEIFSWALGGIIFILGIAFVVYYAALLAGKI